MPQSQKEKAIHAKKQKELRSDIEHTKTQLRMSMNQPLRQSFFRDKLKRLQGGLRK